MSNSEYSIWIRAFIDKINKSELMISYKWCIWNIPRNDFHSTVQRKFGGNLDKKQVLVVAASPDVDVKYRMCKFHLLNWFMNCGFVWLDPSLEVFNMMIMLAHGVYYIYIECWHIDAPCEAAAGTCFWSGFSTNRLQLWSNHLRKF